MALKGAFPGVDRPDCAAQIDRLVASSVLHGSETLCRLLRYLAEHAWEHPATPLKEYQIAREAFGRSADFDPQSDSTVRVHAGRLRAKLEEYYRSEGAVDPVVVELPRGGYALSFHVRTAAPEPAPVAHPTPLQTTGLLLPLAIPERHNRRVAVIVLVMALTAAVAGNVFLLVRRTSASLANEAAPVAVRAFWKPFLASPDDPWVIFSNAEFIGRAETGMRYFDASRDSRDRILDHYTGIGEVLAVHSLDRVFGMLHRGIRVKRGRLLSLDDAQHNSLVFLGSPAENLTLQEIPNTREFVFERLRTGPRKGDLTIANRHPRPGEPEFFAGSVPGGSMTEDYAVVALLPGLDPSRYALILAGVTTLGTEAAAEFVCEPSALERLLAQLGTSAGDAPGPFEAVLRVAVRQGVPIETAVVALRKVR